MGLKYWDLEAPSPSVLQQTHRKRFSLPSDGDSGGNLDPMQDRDHILLTWQWNAPEFSTDFDIFVSEQYKSLPQNSFVDIRLHTDPSSETTKLVILFRDWFSMYDFSSSRSGVDSYYTSTLNPTQVWSPKSEVVFSICLVLKIICLQTLGFLNSCTREIEKMNLRARQSPSADKLRYLVHLEDCRQSSFDGLSHALEVLETLKAWVSSQQRHTKLWDGGKSFDSRFAGLQADLKHLKKEVAALQRPIKDLQQTLHEHLDLTHNRRNTVITIVAAIYVPLSFATSLFGMNINTTTSAGPDGFSNWTQAWIDDSPADVRNSTRALASVVRSSGTLSYSWKAFGITAACLVVTLPLSLAIGSIVRQIYRRTLHYALYWRVIAIVPSLIFIFLSIFGLMCSRDGSETFVNHYTESTAIILFFTFSGGYWACNGALILFELVMAVLNFSNGRQFAFWFFVLFISAGCFAADMVIFRQTFEGNYDFAKPNLYLYFPMMLIPWSTFAYLWIQPWWKSRQREKIVKAIDAGTVAIS